MNTERELLQRAVEALEYWIDGTPHSTDWELLEEIRAHLATEQRKPLSEEEMDKGYEDWMSEPSWSCFILGVRFAEKHHGVGNNHD